MLDCLALQETLNQRLSRQRDSPSSLPPRRSACTFSRLPGWPSLLLFLHLRLSHNWLSGWRVEKWRPLFEVSPLVCQGVASFLCGCAFLCFGRRSSVSFATLRAVRSRSVCLATFWAVPSASGCSSSFCRSVRVWSHLALPGVLSRSPVPYTGFFSSLRGDGSSLLPVTVVMSQTWAGMVMVVLFGGTPIQCRKYAFLGTAWEAASVFCSCSPLFAESGRPLFPARLLVCFPARGLSACIGCYSTKWYVETVLVADGRVQRLGFC